ncbi:MAG: BamA/TamA family outer membrane protein [Labilithrix sp.]|nr:BamA/TamA family outer membrane protein [Labilithrix sp.]MCW5816104.1 BamA/TamA family outer membrane protein [Labilithrix sp.]
MSRVCIKLALLSFGWLLAACAHTRAEKLPGETDLEVSRVSIVSVDGQSDDFSVLLPRLGSRPGNALYTNRYYNPVRVAEDRRRVLTFLQSKGYFDARVEEPDVAIDEAKRRVEITIQYEKGPRYALAGVGFEGAPPGTEPILDARVTARAGDLYDLETMRVARYDMAQDLQREGYGHARVYVRTYVDRSAHTIRVVYFADPGPRTKIGRITIEGTRKVDASDVRARLGLEPGEPYTLSRKEKAELDLYDIGAFAGVVIDTTADVETYFGDVPDSGGVIPPARVAADGTLSPRAIDDTIDLVVHVDEAPSARVRLRGTVEADPTRGDATAGAELQLRNVFGSQHHVTVRGRVGYGVLFSDEVDTPGGLYGDALLRYTRPSLFGRIVDGRLSVRFRDVLYPGFHFRELFAGPGVRSTLARDLFVEADAGFRLGQEVDFGSFDEATRARFALSDSRTYRGAEASGAIVWDARNDPVEPMRGHLLALRVAASPGGALATNRYVLAAPEGRAFVPLSSSFSLGLRASAGWVFGWDDAGVPLGPRFFGGGAFGNRGFGRDRMSPVAPSGTLVGGLSLLESSVELRYLPVLKQAGLVVFVDAGGAGTRANPLEAGVSMAAGIGPRLRLWYVPLSVDLAHQFVRDAELGNHRFLVFARIGEAF